MVVMKSNSNLFILIFLFLLLSKSYSQNFEWASGLGSTVTVKSVGVDNVDNLYITGNFTESASFGDDTFICTQLGDSYIAKFNASGSCLWAYQIKSYDHSSALAIKTDANGNSYVTGIFRGQLTFGLTSITSYSNSVYNMFVAKFDNSGNFIWATKTGENDVIYPYGIALDGNGNSYVTGNYQNVPAHFGVTTLSVNGFYNIFVAKFDEDGNIIWARQANGSGSSLGLGIATDTNGNSIVTGYFNDGSLLFGETNLESNGMLFSVLLLKYNTNGNCTWAKQSYETNGSQGVGVSIDGSGNAYIAGVVQGLSTFGSVTISSANGTDVFVAKFDANGDCIWGKSAGGNGSQNGIGISVDASDYCFITGIFENTISFGSSSLESFGDYDIFIAKYDSEGNFFGALNAGGASFDKGQGICTTNNGQIYLVGIVGGSSTFSDKTINEFGGFISRLSNSGNSPLPVEMSAFSSDIISGRVLLQWKTSSELNNYGFDIERKNRTKNWHKIGFVHGNGNSNSPKVYEYIDTNPTENNCLYRLKQIDFNGNYEYSKVIEVFIGAPSKISLKQNFPNPFNPITKINFELPTTSFVTLKVYDILGNEKEKLMSENLEAGIHEYNFDGSKLTSGVYFYSIQVNGFIYTKKMLLLK